MRHLPLDSEIFVQHRARLAALLKPHALAVVNANDLLPANSDATLPMAPNSDLFYLTGLEQEETVLLLAPQASDESLREVLFLREPNPTLTTWEGYKYSKEDARGVSGIKTVKWLSEFRSVFHGLMCESERVYLNSNEHKRAVVEVQTRDARFIRETQEKYPLHRYERLTPLLHRLRVVKSAPELDLLRKSVEITRRGFERVARFVRPGVNECEIEAEFAHEFIRSRARFAYGPIIASGASSCLLHYSQNDQTCRLGDVLLLDVGAAYANYNADVTRTLPVSGKFSPRQKQIYRAVLRVLRASISGAVVGKLHRDWQKEAQQMMNEELLTLGLLKKADLKKQTPALPACYKYFMHGLGHPLGLDVHDVGLSTQPFAPGWVLTVEPGIYLPEEGFGIRLEDDILLTEDGAVNLTENVPLEIEEIENLMAKR